MSLQVGSSGTSVKMAQIALNSKIFWAPTDVKLITDGQFGARTEAAVKLFQKQNVLAVTGIIDNATAVKLGMYPSDVAVKKTLPLSYTPSKVVNTPNTSSASSFFNENKKIIIIAGSTIVGVVIIASIVNAMRK